jgi:hypothetical protein
MVPEGIIDHLLRLLRVYQTHTSRIACGNWMWLGLDVWSREKSMLRR